MDVDQKIRLVEARDAVALADLLNAIIAHGGTTAFEEPFSPESLAETMLAGPDVICCFVAEERNGSPAGFQTLIRSDYLPRDVGDIGTFTRVGSVQKGTGSRLFAATKAEAARQGLAAINATIRADNLGGLAFYAKMGFVDGAVRRAVPLRDGTAVDRIERSYILRPNDYPASATAKSR